MPKTQIVIDLENGIVSLYAPQPDRLDVILVDWDGESVDPRSNMIEVPMPGGSNTVFVVDFPVQPLSELAGTDVERAIDLAYERGVLEEFAGGPTC